MTEKKTETSNKHVQTTIHCFPHILLSDSQIVKVFSDRGCQTVASVNPETANINFYAVLEFTPYQVIAEGCIREIDLPRKALLQWNLSSSTVFSAESLSNSSQKINREELDLKQKSVLKKRKSDLTYVTSRLTPHLAMQRPVVEQGAQTTLSVAPHVLDVDEVANVFTELAIQTSITCLPNDSISNILPLLKANLSHLSGYTSERSSVLMNEPPLNEILANQADGEDEVEITDETLQILPEELQGNLGEEPPQEEEAPKEPPEEPTKDQPEESPEELAEETAEQLETEVPIEVEEDTPEISQDQTSDCAAQVDTLPVSLFNGEVEDQRFCGCRTKMLNQMANRLQVKASAFNVAPVAFPPDIPFGERLVEVLNTITAVLQTEMANVMEVYTDEEKSPCACKDQAKNMSLKEMRDDSRSCKCSTIEAETNTDKQEPTVYVKKICKCIGTAVPQQVSGTIAKGSQKEIEKSTVICQVLNPDTNQIDTVTEDAVGETVRTITKDTISTKIIIEGLPESPTAESLTVKSNLPAPEKPCTCIPKPDVEVIKPINKSAPTLTETEDVSELVSETTEVPIEFEEILKMATTVPLPEDETIDKTEPPAEMVPQEEFLDEAETSIDKNEPLKDVGIPTEGEEEETAEAVPDEQDESRTQPQPEVVGDSTQSRRLRFIACECHPTEAGAAVPTLFSPEPSGAAIRESELHTTTSSHVDDDASPEKSTKLEVLLKKGVKDVKSVSATSAIVVRATLSCPDTNKDVKLKTSSRTSLPDLREQVIRLKVIYKTGAADQETRIEKLLTPGRPVTIAPNKSQSSRVNQKASNLSTTVSVKTNLSTIGADGKSDGLVCAKSQSAVRKLPATTNHCDCTLKLASQAQAAYPKQFHSFPIEIEEVPFSSMACPLHPQKTPACVPACKLASTPSSHQPSGKTADISGLEIVITYTTEDNENDLQSSSFTYEHEASYEEPYMIELVEAEDATTGVQTDIALGDKLQSESLNSLGETEYKDLVKECGSKTEIPWQNISLPPLGSYSIQPVKQSHQVGIMTEGEEVVEQGVGDESATEEALEAPETPAEYATAPEESATAPEESGTASEESGTAPEESAAAPEESEAAPEDVVDEGEQVGDAGEEEVNHVAEEQPECYGERPKRRELLLYEMEDYKDNEPYMEGLYRAYPNSDEGECGSQTEIPWKDIILPEHCKIKKAPKKCTCKSRQDKLTGMFIPSNKPPRNLEVDEDESLVTLHLGFEEQPSTLIKIHAGGAASLHTISFVSTISDIAQKPRRVPKTFTLTVEQQSASFHSGIGKRLNIPIGPTASEPFSVSTAFGEPSSAIVNIKSSTDRPFASQRIPVPGDREDILNIVNPSTYTGGMPTATRSCTATHAAYKDNMSIRNVSSMPQMSSQKSITATVSLKKLGPPEKVVTQTKNLVPGDNCMTLQVPGTAMNVNLTMSTPSGPIYTAAGGQASCASPNNAPCSSLCPPRKTEFKEVFSAAKCPCKDKAKLNTFRQDPVIAALEAYEAEMRPLRQALTQLQEKIRNLNMPEMKGCLCTTILQNPPPPCGVCPPISVQSRVQFPSNPSKPPPGTCAYFQPARFRPPVVSAPYGHLPSPTITSRLDPYMATPPNFTPPNTGGRQDTCFCERGQSQRSKSGGHSRHRKEHRSNRDHGRTYPREDLAMEAKRYGMYPDYRGRRYLNERAAYQDSFIQESRHKKSGSHDKYKTRHVISIHSRGNVTSDHGGYDSQGASDADDSFHQAYGGKTRRDKLHNNQSKIVSRYSAKSKRDDNIPCRDMFDTQMRDGQAVKTSPDEFLFRPTQSIGRRSPHSISSIVSKTKIHIKLPRN